LITITRIVGRNMTTNGMRITSICKSQKITFQGTSNKEYLGVPRVYLIHSNASNLPELNKDKKKRVTLQIESII